MDRILCFAVGGSLTDSVTFIVGDVDATKRLGFQVDNQTTATTLTLNTGAQTANRQLSVPVLSSDDTIATRGLANTFVNLQTFVSGLAVQANITFDTGTGTKIGTATNEKLAFYNSTPVVQQTGDILTALSTYGLVASPTITVQDSTFRVYGSGDSTKKLAFEVDAQTTNKTLTIDTGAQTLDRTLSVPVLAGNDTIGTLAVANVWSAINNFANATAASSMTAGAVTIGNGTALTNTAIGGGKIYTGQYLQAGTAAGGTNPGVIVNINNTGNGATNPDLAILNSGSAASSRAGFLLSVHATDYTQLFANAAVFGASAAGSSYGGTTDAGKVAFYAQGASVTRMLLGCYANAPLDLMTNNVVSLSISAAGVVNIPTTTSASSSTTGALTIGNGTAATNVAIGGGNINAGGTLIIGSTTDSTTITSGGGQFLGGVGVSKQLTCLKLSAIETTTYKNMHNVNSSALAAGAGKSSTLWLDFVSSGFGAGDRAMGMSAVIESDNSNLLYEWQYFNGSTYTTFSRYTGSTGVFSFLNVQGFGYGVGAGGTVTQITSRTTGVTINKACGSITLVSAAGSATYQSFTVTNSTVAATDTVRVCQKSGTDLYEIHVTNVAAGTFQITYRTTGGTTSEQPVFNFSILKAVAS